MIKYPNLIVSDVLYLKGAWVATYDERQNYELCKSLFMVIHDTESKRFLINKFGHQNFNQKFQRVSSYFSQVNILKNHIDMHENNILTDKSPEVKIKLYKQVVKIQSNFPLIYYEIWELLYPLIKNSNLNSYPISKQHTKPTETKFASKLRIKIKDERGDKTASFDRTKKYA